jgi:hypothetical protein
MHASMLPEAAAHTQWVSQWWDQTRMGPLLPTTAAPGGRVHAGWPAHRAPAHTQVRQARQTRQRWQQVGGKLEDVEAEVLQCAAGGQLRQRLQMGMHGSRSVGSLGCWRRRCSSALQANSCGRACKAREGGTWGR